MIGGLTTVNRYLLAGAGIVGLVAFGGAPAQAQDVQQLEVTLKQMQAQMAALQKQVAEAKAAAAAAQDAAAKSSNDKPDLVVKWKGAPELSSSDKKFSFKVRGRLEADYVHVDQDTPVTSFPDVSGTELRRARLGIEGIFYWNYKYVFEVDFANDTTRVKDAYVQYQGFKIGDDPLLFRIGNFKTFNTFEDETSDRFVDTMERASFINAWDIDRQIGFGTMYYAKHYGLAGGVFGERAPSPSDQALFPPFTGDEDLTLTARAFAAPINRDIPSGQQVLFFGASFRDRQAGNDQPLFTYGNNARGADFHLTNAPIVTGRIGDEDRFWGLEGAVLWGPFAFQGEYAQLDVNLPGGKFVRNNPPGSGQLTTINNPFVGIPDPTFNGWYVEGSWFFGGHKTYEDDGRWGRPKIDNPMFYGSKGWGALQIVGKYDVLNMSDSQSFNLGPNPANDPNTGVSFTGACANTTLYPGTVNNSGKNQTHPNSVPLCGDMKTWVVDANWWMTEYMRLMFQYSQSDLSGYPIKTTNASLPPGQNNGFDGANIKGFGMRMQIDW